MDAGDVRARFADMRWFHSIDFGEFASSGRFKPGSPQNITLFGAMEFLKDIDFSGASFLDIGAVDGLASFGVSRLGASRVCATESYSSATFLAARSALGLDVDYVPNTQIKDLVQRFGRGAFDAILCSGVIYHMLNPASAFFECRKIIKEGGLLIVETPYHAESDAAAIFINSEEEMVDEVYTYSVPTKRAVTGLMRLAGFEILGIRTIARPDRITVLGQAVGVERITNKSRLLKRIHEVDLCDFEFRLRDWVPSPVVSSILYDGVGGEASIDYRSHDPQFPFHPPRDKPTVGRTAWTTPEGNK